MLKLNRQVSDEDQIQVLQTMLDDSRERQSELETESRWGSRFKCDICVDILVGFFLSIFAP